jgi:AraC-like DNA-binding protein
MTSTIRTDEVHDFTYAVAGAEIEFVRKDVGHGPAVMTRADGGQIQLSAGGMDFSTVMESQLPPGSIAMQLVTHDPGGVTMCGQDVDPGRPALFAPETPVFGHLPAGVRATTVVTTVDAVAAVADDLRLDATTLELTRLRMTPTPEVDRLVGSLRQLTVDPGLLEVALNGTRLLERIAVALAVDGPTTARPANRRDSGRVVALAIEYAEQTGSWLPTLGELCRASFASESTLRAAFVEVMGIPPTTYFHLRVLRELRRLLVVADPRADTVTVLATSLGLTQLGRMAGRYRLVYGETPSETLRRTR